MVNFFLVCNFPCWTWCLLSLSLSLHTSKKNQASSSSYLLTRKKKKAVAFPNSSLLHTDQNQFSQPILIWNVPPNLDRLLSGSFQCVILGRPKLDTLIEMQSLKCQIGEGETFCGLLLALLLVQPHILWLSSLLIACIQISHILFCKSALSQLPACTVTWGCSALAWDWAFLFAELQDFPTDPYLQLIHIPLMNCNSASQTGRVNFTVYQLESIHHPSPCLFIKIPNIMGCIFNAWWDDTGIYLSDGLYMADHKLSSPNV